MNNFDLSKLNKYQKGMIIASLIFLISMIGFIFNSRVRLSKSYVEVPEIIEEEIKDTDSSIEYKDLMNIIIFSIMTYFMFKMIRWNWDV